VAEPLEAGFFLPRNKLESASRLWRGGSRWRPTLAMAEDFPEKKGKFPHKKRALDAPVCGFRFGNRIRRREQYL
jgi:hypothetical protein